MQHLPEFSGKILKFTPINLIGGGEKGAKSNMKIQQSPKRIKLQWLRTIKLQ